MSNMLTFFITERRTNSMSKELCEKLLVVLGKRVVRNNVNSTCAFITFQPKLPKGADKFRKQ